MQPEDQEAREELLRRCFQEAEIEQATQEMLDEFVQDVLTSPHNTEHLQVCMVLKVFPFDRDPVFDGEAVSFKVVNQELDHTNSQLIAHAVGKLAEKLAAECLEFCEEQPEDDENGEDNEED